LSTKDKLDEVKSILTQATGGTTTFFQGKWVDHDSFFRYYWACCKALKALEDES